MVVSAEIVKHDDSLTTLKVQGTIDGNVSVHGRIVVERFNLSERYPALQDTDAYLRAELRPVLARLLPADSAQ